MTSSFDWALVLPIGGGIAALLVGIGVFIVCLRLGGLIGRVGKTLDEVDRQIPALSEPVALTLTHVGGIANTADATIARLGSAVAQLELVAANATKTANSVGHLVSGVASSLKKPS